MYTPFQKILPEIQMRGSKKEQKFRVDLFKLYCRCYISYIFTLVKEGKWLTNQLLTSQKVGLFLWNDTLIIYPAFPQSSFLRRNFNG